MWNLKKSGTDASMYKIVIESQMQRTNLWLPRGKVGEGINWEIGIHMCIMLYYKTGNKKKVLGSTENSLPQPGLTCMGIESKRQ